MVNIPLTNNTCFYVNPPLTSRNRKAICYIFDVFVYSLLLVHGKNLLQGIYFKPNYILCLECYKKRNLK